MPANNTNGAIHLTTLDLDISKLQAQVQTVNSDINNMAKQALENAEKMRNAFGNMGGTSGNQSGENILGGLSTASIDSAILKIQNLTKQYASFNATIAGSNIKDTGLQKIAQDAKDAENALKQYIEAINANKNITPEIAQKYKELQLQLSRLRTEYNDLQTVQNAQAAQQRALNAQYKDMEASIKPAIATLKELEKIGRGSTKTGAAELRKEYENLASSLRNISVSDAQRQLDGLNSRLSTLTSTAQTGTSAIHRFVDAFTGRARFMAISTIITTITNSIRGVKDAIIETEDAAIELIRVLDNPPDMSVISEELYDIAYEYGQSFENVQDVAVKFAQTGMEWSEVLDAVRATMLGLNTAELEVSTATNGLIAVMSQFNIEAESLEEVIDKINITADNFPVTSEKIVAALQRTGASAAAAGMTLEQTIGIITALSEATGRSGENIGTALNSIINFTTNAKALDKFEKFLNLSSGTLQGQNPLAVWTALGQAIKDDGEALGQMMAQSEEFAELFSSDIADAIGLTGQLNEAIAHQEDVYNAAGTYRKTYFIALLNNIATATDAIKNMENAIGYSEEENVTAMEALSKKLEQLSVAARELAVQFGQTGFLDVMKDVVEFSTSVLKLSENIGGLRTMLLALLTVMVMVKAQKIVNWIGGIQDGIHNAFYVISNSIKMFQVDIRNAGGLLNWFTTATTSSTSAIAGFGITLQGALGIIALVSTAISMLVGWFQKTEQEAAKLRSEQIALAKEANTNIQNVVELYEAYEKAGDTYNGTAESANALKEASDSLSDALGTEKNSVDELTNSFEEMSEAQKNAVKGEILAKIFDLEEGMKAVRAKFAISMKEDFWTGVFSGMPFKQFETYTKDSAGNIKKQFLDGMTLTPEEASKAFHEMEEVYSNLVEAGGDANYELARQVKAAMDKIGPYIKDFEDLVKEQREASKSARKFGLEIGGTGKKIQSAGEAIKIAKNEFRNLADAATSAQGPIVNLTGSFSTMEEYMESLDKSIDDLTKRVDGFQSAYETVTGIIEEYNKTGYMTADMMQTLMGLDPEYIQLLDIKSGKLQLNQEKLNELSTATDNYMQELLILQTVKQIDSMLTEAQAASDAGLTVEEYRLKVASQDVQSTTYQLVKQFYSGQISADAFKSGIARVAEQSGVATGYLNDLTTAALNATSALGSLGGQWIASRDSYTSQDFEAAGFTPGDPAFYEWVQNNRNKQPKLNVAPGPSKYYTPSGGGGGGGGGGKTAEEQFEETIKNQQEALDDLLSTYEHGIKMIQYQSPVMDESATEEIVAIYKKMQDAVHEQAESFRAQGLSEDSEYIQKLKENWWEYQNAINEAYQEQYNTMADVYDHEIELLNRNSPAGNAEQIIAAYKIMQEKAHELAEYYRSQGLAENSEYIQKLQKDWWDYEDKIREVKEESLQHMLDVYDHNAFLIEQNSKHIDSAIQKNIDDALQAYDEELALVAEKGIDLNKTIFGNIDTNNRQILNWTSENLQRFSEELASWGYSIEELQGSMSTIMGGSEWFGDDNGIEIAFSPILQTEDGPVLLSSDTVREYIWGLIDKAGESWTSEDLFRLDTEGLEFDGIIIKNLLADIGDTAIKTGEAMHYVGSLGSVNQAAAELIEAQSSMKSADQLVSIYKSAQNKIHDMAEEYRAMGYNEESDLIRELQELWWGYEDKIKDVYADISDKIIEEHAKVIAILDHQLEHAASLDSSEWELNLLVKKREEATQAMEDAHKVAEQLRNEDAIGFADLIEEKSNEWWEYWSTVQEVNERIAELMLKPYDEFISMADSMDLWEYMDFSKLDYLQEKLKKINELYEDGTLSAQKYNELLKEINVKLYNAQVEELERRKKELEDEYDKLIEAREKEIDKLKDEKDAIQDRADAVVDGYKAEIEVWKKRKEETENYYDKLIDELQDVQKANDRINKQIDYYNARQKIITNLEQARARSGVEWREKEMEYQQQLIDLDEDWNRTQQDWNIEDQIDRLEELKNLAIADIDATIDKINAAIDQTEDEAEAAIKAIDDQIDSIEDTIKGLEETSKAAVEAVGEEIKKLSKIIAEAIQKGLEDGLADTNDEFIQAGKDTNAALLAEINKGVNTGIGSNLQNIESVINKATGGMYSSMKDSFFTPVANGMSNLAGGIKNLLGNAFDNAATDGYTSFKNKLINPLTNDISAAMGQATKSVDNKNKNIVSKYRTDGGGSYGFAQKQKDSTILVQNYVTNTNEAVKKTSSIIQNLKV